MTLTLRPHQQTGVDILKTSIKGQVIVPTGGGKTIIGILDAKDRFDNSPHPINIIVVAPRILLAEQLCSEYLEFITNNNVHVAHVHSGETSHFLSTKASEIELFTKTANAAGEHTLIFTTYHSLHRVVEAGVRADTVICDEAHNSVQRHFFPAVEHYSAQSERIFYYTATRKTSVTINKPGMNDVEVYGEIIHRVPAPELVKGGYILPPKVKVIDMNQIPAKAVTPCIDRDNILETIKQIDIKKILVCVKTSKQLINLMQTDFADRIAHQGYSYLYITAKTGAIIDGRKVSRDEFFRTLNAWGQDDNKKFICLHRSILSEGINVKQLEAVVFLRNMDCIEMVQTIGRVLRKGGAQKTYGLCVVPSYTKVGIATEKAIQRCVDIVFEKGEVLDSVVRK